jgi:3-phenylpropionate/trans-cinnamate dioxygenase alpha subunit
MLAEIGDDVVVVPGIQKFMIECNWKFTVDNLFDWYHPQITHVSAFAEGVMPRPPVPRVVTEKYDMDGVATADGTALSLPDNLGSEAQPSVTVIGEYGHAIAGPTTAEMRRAGEFDQSWRDRPAARAALGPVGAEVGGHPNIFPTAWVALTSQLSLRIPRSPNLTEVWWFTFVDRAADPAKKAMMIGQSNHIFGPAGLLEQEDGENWAQSTATTTGQAGRRIPQLLKMDLGRGRVIHEGGLARIEGKVSEHAQLWTYAAWAHWMAGESWEELKANTTPGDVL